jgi:RNA polymerase sigma-70 factor, ECF subfamily
VTSAELTPEEVARTRRRVPMRPVAVQFDDAFREHAAAVYRVARRIGGGNNAADVTQEVFLRLLTHPERFDPARGSLRSYLCTVARGVAIDVARREHARRDRDQRGAPLRPVADLDPEHAAIRRDDALRVRAALRELRPDERLAIVEAYGSEVTYRQAALRLRVPEGTVKSRIRIGLTKLRAGLDDG